MFFTIYVSSATSLFSEKDLIDLLEVSRRNNQAADITGLLLYKEGNFMQCLEGERVKVEALTQKIQRDPRHNGMITLIEQENAEREFGNWSMGFRRLSDEEIIEAPGYNDFLNVPLTSEKFLRAPSASMKLMLNFKRLMR